MLEFSLYFEKNLLPYFNDLKTDLKKQFLHHASCVAIGIKDEHYVLMLALPKDVFNQYKSDIKHKVAEIVCTYYKPYYILQSLKNFDITNPENIILLDILSSYENQQDIDDISKKIAISDKLYLKSYINFNLTEQKKKWQDIGNLINENSLFLIDTTIKQELIKFLMSGLQSQTEILTLSKDNGLLHVFDGNMSNIKIKTVFYAQNEYDNLLYVIINKSPKRIQVKNYKDFDIMFLDVLYRLFGENVKLFN